MHSHKQLVIGIPLFNEKEYIHATLEAVACQTHKDFLVLIADNSSDDGSSEICLDFIKNDPRFKYHKHESNIGSIANFRYIYENTDSQYFMWLGAHDIIRDSYIKTQLKVFEADPTLALVYSRTTWIDEHGNITGESNGGDFVHNDNCGLTRYLKTLSGPWGECTAANGVFRRSALSGIKFFPFLGPDHYILTRAQFFGRFFRTEAPIYLRREFLSPRGDYLERITGTQTKISPSNSNSMLPLALAQTREFLSLNITLSEKIINLPRLILGFESAYGLYTNPARSAIGHFMKRLSISPARWSKKEKYCNTSKKQK